MAGNSNVMEIPRPPEGFVTRAVTHCGIYDAATGGKLVLHGLLRRNGQPAPYPLGHDSTIKIGANGVQFDLINQTCSVVAGWHARTRARTHTAPSPPKPLVVVLLLLNLGTTSCDAGSGLFFPLFLSVVSCPSVLSPAHHCLLVLPAPAFCFGCCCFLLPASG